MSSPKLTKFALALARIFIRPGLTAYAGGDLEEEFRLIEGESGRLRAQLWLWRQAIFSIPSFIKSRIIWSFIMMTNYLKTVFRNINKYRTHTIINITGLATGMACFILIMFYVVDELRYDRFHENRDDIYRIAEHLTNEEGKRTDTAAVPPPLAPALQNEFASISEIVRIFPYSQLNQVPMISSTAEKIYPERRLAYVDSSFFKVFSFELISGDRESVLRNPLSIVLTETMAQKYFGDADPNGQPIDMILNNNRHTFTVTGIMEDFPEHSHFKFDILASFTSLQTIEPWILRVWEWNPMYAYIQLADGYNSADLETYMSEFMVKHRGMDEATKHSYFLQPLTSIHLYSNLENELELNGNATYVLMFSLIAVFILALAFINFINISSAGSIRRAHEVGLRKALGAQRGQLIVQFLGESIVLAAIAFVIATGVLLLILPYFNSFTGKNIELTSLNILLTLVLPIVFVTFTGLAAGSYPAFLLSRFKPASTLRGLVTAGGSFSGTIRKVLVIFQFSIAGVLIIATLILSKQLEFIRTKELGFNKEHIVVMNLVERNDQTNYGTLKQNLLLNPNILGVTASSHVPGKDDLYTFTIVPETHEKDTIEMNILSVDHDFIKTYGMQLTTGRDFSIDYPTDSTRSFIVNESFVNKFSWDDPVGKKIFLNWHLYGYVPKSGEIIGTINDFHISTLHKSIDPILIHVIPPSYYFDYLSVRIGPDDIPATLAYMKTQWDKFNSNRPFEYFFLDDQFDALYKSDTQFNTIITLFAILAILISCLGLFGLSSFTAQQRKKEIGIRKVLGAEVSDIILLMLKDYLKLVIAALIISIPCAHILMNNMLQNYAYRTETGIGTYIFAGYLMLMIACFSVIFQALKSAKINPAVTIAQE